MKLPYFLYRISHRITSLVINLQYPFLRMNKSYFLSWYHIVPQGWRKSVLIPLSKELKRELKREHILYDFSFLDCKEKYGRLDLYPYYTTDEIDKILAKYEYISERTCIHCGRCADYITNSFITPLCKDCISDYQKAMSSQFYTDMNWYGYTKSSI